MQNFLILSFFLFKQIARYLAYPLHIDEKVRLSFIKQTWLSVVLLLQLQMTNSKNK